eukprot:CAMPEP_0117420664 /NCGR_PEP_ID=MMETSP0758-20121206/1948_1 /TAXON_ID=63605 /ORGANISM="Percolomonas cosmopolitus, Strain AE-1 (ATCC 50343)" /LENGTH=229 /DNA_ID=CAMNT_0005202399 /DNA_START=449 /DNA_END=1135 /DNA_ORIENTATION=+
MKKLAVVSDKNSIPEFSLGRLKKKNYPKEIVFIGRSNVGKSSLLNSICSRGLQEVSDKPGKTVELSFYALKNYVTVVDVPGYGFAYYNMKEVQDAIKEGKDPSSILDKKGKWLEAIDMYLNSDKGHGKHRIAHAYVLLDGRHGIKKADVHFIQKLESNRIPYTFVLTKTDVIFPEELVQTMMLMKEQMISLGYFQFDYNNVILSSSRSKSGIGFMRSHIGEQVYMKEQL